MPFDRDLAIDLILAGTAPEAAIAQASAPNADSAIWLVQPTGSLGSTPDPACVAHILSGIKNPTRQDIADAIRNCSK